jgi:hypothetical protein
VQSLPLNFQVDTVSSGLGSVNSVTVDKQTGELYLSGGFLYVIWKISTNDIVSVFAGKRDEGGQVDGNGVNARFGHYNDQISYCSYDGNIYLTDTSNNAIRRLNKMADVVTVAGVNFPSGIACNQNNGDLIVVERDNIVLRLVSYPSRTVTLFAGQIGVAGFSDGMGTYARFATWMYHLTQNAVNGHFYLADYYNNLIRQVTQFGLVSTIAGHAGVSGSSDSIGTMAYFFGPTGVSCDDISGAIIVGDLNNHRIRSIDLSTNLVTTIAGSGQGGSETLAGNGNGIGTYSQVRRRVHRFNKY